MADIYDKTKRSAVMSKVHSKGNRSTELRIIELFKSIGLTGWRRNYPVKGKPDFVFLKHRIAIFTDGCFWHGHDCRNTRPSDNSEYWTKKRNRNMHRDMEITSIFEKRGWIVLRIWECELKKNNEAIIVERIRETINKTDVYYNPKT